MKVTVRTQIFFLMLVTLRQLEFSVSKLPMPSKVPHAVSKLPMVPHYVSKLPSKVPHSVSKLPMVPHSVSKLPSKVPHSNLSPEMGAVNVQTKTVVINI